MKRRRTNRVERRRAMPEIDLLDEGKPKVPSIPRISGRGCIRLFGQVLTVGLLIGSAYLKLR
jgi:hypothetical protein